MHELGIPIDLVAGSSMGSPLGAGIAIDYPIEHFADYVHELYTGVVDYTIPVVSLAKGEQLTRSIEKGLGGWDFEDCWRPFFCMSTNITQAREMVHDSGEIARAVRASVSIPGVYPPVAFGEDLHVDGGVLNNLPGDIMRKRHPTATIIGVDVAPPSGPRARSDDPALSVSGWQALRTAASKKKNEHPGIAAMLLRTMITASIRQRKRSVDRGDFDLYLDLDLRGISLLDFGATHQVAPAGYEAAMPRLEAWLAEREQH
jgi:predicted acylesterase/phospholipase RssA